MSFQGYLRTIEGKTGRDVEGLRRWADDNGLAENGRLRPGVKAGQVVDLAKSDLELGHGHAMAIYALLSGKNPEES